MEKEDLLAQVMRKNDKIIREREETRQFRDEISAEKLATANRVRRLA